MRNTGNYDPDEVVVRPEDHDGDLRALTCRSSVAILGLWVASKSGDADANPDYGRWTD